MGWVYLSIILLHCQPAVVDEEELFLGLQVIDGEVIEVPAAELAFARVVMPDAGIVEATQRSVASIHHHGIRAYHIHSNLHETNYCQTRDCGLADLFGLQL